MIFHLLPHDPWPRQNAAMEGKARRGGAHAGSLPARRGAILHILNLVVLSGLASETEWKRVEGERRKDGRMGERLPQTT